MEPAISNPYSMLQKFGELSTLNEENLARVGEAIRPAQIPAGAILHSNLEQGWLIYLIKGKLTLINEHGERYDTIEESAPSSYSPVFSVGGSHDNKAEATIDVELIRIDRLHVEVLLSRQLTEATQVVEVGFDVPDVEVFGSILEAHESGTLEVPSLPEVASKVNEAASNNDMDFVGLAAIIQSDPPFTARLIQAANGPNYRGVAEIGTLSGAISRLGLDGARNLVMAIAVEQLVKNVHPAAKQCIWDFYHEAGEVGALCFVLAKKTASMREERAYMAGLLHGLGMVPIVNHACQVLMPDPNIETVNRVALHLVESVSSWLLSEWGLDAELCDAAESASDWYRSVDKELSVIDLVIVSRLLRMVAQGKQPPVEISTTDIGKTLLEKGCDLSNPIDFLNDIQEELETARQLLS